MTRYPGQNHLPATRQPRQFHPMPPMWNLDMPPSFGFRPEEHIRATDSTFPLSHFGVWVNPLHEVQITAPLQSRLRNLGLAFLPSSRAPLRFRKPIQFLRICFYHHYAEELIFCNYLFSPRGASCREAGCFSATSPRNQTLDICGARFPSATTPPV